MTAAEADGKRVKRQGTTPATTETDTSSNTEKKPEDLAFELTRARKSAHIGPSTARAVFYPVSQNGYRCNSYPGENNNIANGGAGTPGSWTPNDVDPFEVVFGGGDADPMSPRSMKTARKWLILSVLSGAGLCFTTASSIYSSTYAQMDAEFNCSRIVSTLGISTYVLGIGFGPMFLGPLSEFFGRRLIYLIAWTLYVLWIIPQAVAHNIATMVVARLFDGLAGSAFLAVSGGTVSDLFNRDELQAPMLFHSLVQFLGPALGPVLGGFINSHANWRWTYYVLLIWAFIQLVLVVFLVPETYHPVILRDMARARRKKTGDDRWKAPMEKANKSIARTISLSLLRPFQLLIFEFMVLNLCVFSAILLGILYLFFGAFPLVFRNAHDFNLWQVGLSFLGILVGTLMAGAADPMFHGIRCCLVARLEKKTGIQVSSEPEFRLPPAICGSFLVTIGLFTFGWTTFPHVHWIVPIIGSSIFGAG
ncbi:hypothetical protein FALCPG4_010127 [Fusarium falciforme]